MGLTPFRRPPPSPGPPALGGAICGGGCWRGIAAMPAICPGGAAAIRIASGSARSCCSRRRWPRCAATSSDSSRRCRRSTPWPPPRKTRCCGFGKAWAITAAPGNSIGPPESSSPNIGGQFPADAEQVRRLPGIGRYTAGAILSIAFDAPEPILEANTIRLLSRLLAYAGDTHSTAGQRLLWHAAQTLLPARCRHDQPGADGAGQPGLPPARSRLLALPVGGALSDVPRRIAENNSRVAPQAANRIGSRGS